VWLWSERDEWPVEGVDHCVGIDPEVRRAFNLDVESHFESCPQAVGGRQVADDQWLEVASSRERDLDGTPGVCLVHQCYPLVVLSVHHRRGAILPEAELEELLV